MCPRLLPEDFKSWPIPYQELVPYYLTAEQIMNVTGAYAKGSALQEKLLHRLRFGGFPDATDLPLAVDLDVTRYGQLHSNVFFSSLIFMAYALNMKPFDLAVNTRAVRFSPREVRAAGVK